MKSQQWKDQIRNGLSFQQQQKMTMVKSEYYDNYRADIDLSLIDVERTAVILRQHGIEYNPDKQYQQFAYEITESYSCFEILKLRIFIAYFSFTVTILNENRQNPFENVASNQDGKYGFLYFYNTGKKWLAIKSYEYNEHSFHEIFQRALQEWSVLKICSILQCAPRVDHQIGFDLVVYDNCIQIAMDKCTKLDSISEKWYQPLKQQLQIMHRFNIIHADIKPDNIVFSQSANKPVFIDFGFSSVIKENAGYKKLTHFKGSPGFCSGEMLNLLSVNSRRDYVDLYYNDLYSLKSAFNQCQSAENVIALLQEPEITTLNSLFTNQELKQLQKMYFLYRFKYLYIMEESSQIQPLLSNTKLTNLQILPILRFIKEVYHNIFNAVIFEKLKGYNYIHEYKAIEKLLILEKSKIRMHMTQQPEQDTGDYQRHDFSKKYNQFLLRKDIFIAQIVNFNAYLQFLLSRENEDIPRERQFDVLLYCLRFNIKNIKFKDKIRVAVRWRNILINSVGENHVGSIDDIKVIFKFMLRYCEGEPFTEWKKQNIFEILFHAIILNVEVINSFSIYMKKMTEHYLTLANRMMLKSYLIELQDRLQSLDLTVDINSSALAFLVVLDEYIKKLTLDIKAANITNVSEEEQIILHLEREIQDKLGLKQQNFQKISDLVQYLKCPRLHSFYSKVLFERKLRYEMEHNINSQSFIKIRQILNSEIVKNIDIHLLFLYSQIYMLKLQLLPQFKRMVEQIKAIIDCGIIYQKFKIEKSLFLIDRGNCDRLQVIQSLSLLEKNYLVLDALDLGVKNTLFFLLIKIHKIQDIGEEFVTLIRSLHQKFSLTKNNIKKNSKHCAYDFQAIMLELDIQKEFLTLLPECLSNFQEHLENMKLQIESFDSSMLLKINNQSLYPDNITKVRYYVQRQFQYSLSLYFYFRRCNKKKDQLACLIKLSYIAKMLGLTFIFDYVCYEIILISNVIMDEQIFSQYLHLNFNQAQGNKTAINYFLHSKPLLLMYTLQYFHKINEHENMVNLLQLTSRWIAETPLEPYILSYLKSIEQFYLFLPSYFSFEAIKRIFLSKQRDNPYISILFIFCVSAEKQEKQKLMALRMTATMLGKLTLFTKQQLLQKYFRIIVTLKSIRSRKIEQYLLRYEKRIFKQKPFSSLLMRKVRKESSQALCFKEALRKCISKLAN